MRIAFTQCFSPLLANTIDTSLGTCEQSRGTNDYFDTAHVAFEHQFTIMGSLSGLSVAYLPAVIFQHIGEDASAYILNNFSRPWDTL